MRQKDQSNEAGAGGDVWGTVSLLFDVLFQVEVRHDHMPS